MKNLKLKTTFFSLVAVMTLSVLMISCEQEPLGIVIDDIDGIRPADENTPELSLDNAIALVAENAPDLNDDVYRFNDLNQFIQYYNGLDAILDEDDQRFNEIVEAKEELTTVHIKFFNDVFVNPEDRYQPFIADPVMMGIVNEHFEFQVDNVLLTYANNEIILTSEIGDAETRRQTRNMDKGAALNVRSIPSSAFPVSGHEIETLLGPWGNVDYVPLDLNEEVLSVRNACTGNNSNSAWGWSASGVEGLSTRTRAYKTWCCFKEETIVVGKSWRNGAWRNDDSDLRAEVWGTRRNDNCNYDNDEHEVKTCTNCDDKRARISTGKGAHHRNGDVQGYGRKVLPGVSITDWRYPDFGC